MPVDSGGGVHSVGVWGGENRETLTASHCLAFKGRSRQFGTSANQIN